MAINRSKLTTENKLIYDLEEIKRQLRELKSDPTAAGTGTVTSIGFSGGTTGLTVSGSPVTTSGTITLAGTLAVANGGTGATSAGSALTALGGQPLDSDLTTLAGLTATTDNFIVSVSSAWASQTPAQVRTTLGLVIGTNVQAWDADLDTWAGKTAPSGTVLGTSDIQVLSNKDLTSGTNTFPTLNQNTTGSAATLTTARAIYGNNFNGSAALTGIIDSTFGGTGNGFAKLSGPATSEKTFTLPNASATILTDNAAVTVAQGGTGQTSYINGQLLIGNTTGNTLAKATLTAGTGIAITNGASSITVGPGAGGIVQQVDTLSTAVSTGTTAIPADNTIPQSGEGNEYMTLAITPTSTTNKLIIEVGVLAAHSIATVLLGTALFQDSGVDALAAVAVSVPAAGANVNPTLYHSMAAGTTSSTTFKVRVGGNVGSTTTFNGSAGARWYGAITHSYIRITELKV